MPDWAIAIISIILGFTLSVIYNNTQEKKQEQKVQLKIHFDELKEGFLEEAILFFHNISNRHSTLTYHNDKLSYSADATETTWPMYHYGNYIKEQYENFKIHFPSLANSIEKLKKDIAKSNKKNKELNKKIESVLTDKTHIAVQDLSNDTGSTRPYFRHLIVVFVRLSYRDMAPSDSVNGNKGESKFDFSKARIVAEKDHWLVTLADGRTCAEVVTKEEAEKCKQALIEIMNNSELQGKSILLDALAILTLTDTKVITEKLESIMKRYSTYRKSLKINRQCSTCKMILGEE